MSNFLFIKYYIHPNNLKPPKKIVRLKFPVYTQNHKRNTSIERVNHEIGTKNQMVIQKSLPTHILCSHAFGFLVRSYFSCLFYFDLLVKFSICVCFLNFFFEVFFNSFCTFYRALRCFYLYGLMLRGLFIRIRLIKKNIYI